MTTLNNQINAGGVGCCCGVYYGATPCMPCAQDQYGGYPVDVLSDIPQLWMSEDEVNTYGTLIGTNDLTGANIYAFYFYLDGNPRECWYFGPQANGAPPPINSPAPELIVEHDDARIVQLDAPCGTEDPPCCMWCSNCGITGPCVYHVALTGANYYPRPCCISYTVAVASDGPFNGNTYPVVAMAARDPSPVDCRLWCEGGQWHCEVTAAGSGVDFLWVSSVGYCPSSDPADWTPDNAQTSAHSATVTITCLNAGTTPATFSDDADLSATFDCNLTDDPATCACYWTGRNVHAMTMNGSIPVDLVCTVGFARTIYLAGPPGTNTMSTVVYAVVSDDYGGGGGYIAGQVLGTIFEDVNDTFVGANCCNFAGSLSDTRGSYTACTYFDTSVWLDGSVVVTTTPDPPPNECPSAPSPPPDCQEDAPPTVTPDINSSAVSYFGGIATSWPAGTYIIKYVSGALNWDSLTHPTNNLCVNYLTAFRYRVVYADSGAASANAPGTFNRFATQADVEADNAGEYITITHTGGPIGVWPDDTGLGSGNYYADNVLAPGGSAPTFSLCTVGDCSGGATCATTFPQSYTLAFDVVVTDCDNVTILVSGHRTFTISNTLIDPCVFEDDGSDPDLATFTDLDSGDWRITVTYTTGPITTVATRRSCNNNPVGTYPDATTPAGCPTVAITNVVIS